MIVTRVAKLCVVASLIQRTLLVAGCSLALFISVGCGGAASTTNNLAQNPLAITQPAESPSTPASGSGSQAQPSQPSQPLQPSGTSSPPAPLDVPPGAQTAYSVQTLADWQWCTAELNHKPCASGLGNATSTMTPNQQTPSMSGASSQFTLGGPTPYSNALWWKSFGPNSTPTHFVYDLYFYMQDPSAPEALEFDMNQSLGGVRYTWGTECSYRNTAHWDIWNPESEHWETTSVPCPVVSANSWHHLTWQGERVNGQVHYIAVTLDGIASPVDKYYNPQPNYSGDDLNVAFQMDGDYRQDPYNVWLDDVSLSWW